MNIRNKVTGELASITAYNSATGEVTDINSPGNISAVANITAAYFIGNGSQLTGISAGSSYSNADVVANLANLGSNPISTTGNITADVVESSTSNAGILNVVTVNAFRVNATNRISSTGNVIGAYFIGDGSQLTGISGSYGNANVSEYLASGNDVAGYGTAGDVAANNIVASGGLSALGDSFYFANVSVTGDVTAANFIGNGSQLTGLPAGYSNSDVSTYLASGNNTANVITTGNLAVGTTITILPNTVASFGGNVNSYLQVNLQNTSNGANAESDFVITADNGTDSVNYINMGIVNSGYDNTTPSNSLGNIIWPADGYIYSQGNTANSSANGGNLAIGTTVSSKTVKIFAGGNSTSNIVATFSNNKVTIGSGSGTTSQGINAVAVGINAGTNTQGNGTVAVGFGSGGTTQGTNSVAIGTNAGASTQGGAAVSIGSAAGQSNQGASSVAIGSDAGKTSQAQSSVAVGNGAGGNAQATQSVAIGYQAGSNTQSTNSVAVGAQSGLNTQGIYGVAIGWTAGQTTQGNSAVAIGQQTASTNQGANAVAIGGRTAETSQGTLAVAIGQLAGRTSQGASSVAIGTNSGQSLQGTLAVAVGSSAGTTSQGNLAVAVGASAGSTSQGANAVAIGYQAGSSQSESAVAIGYQAGLTSQGNGSVSLGYFAGQGTQGNNSVAIGRLAGRLTQGINTVAVGFTSGYNTQGNNSVAIGSFAGAATQAANSIIINATGANLNSSSEGVYIAPIRNDTSNVTNVVYYNTSTKELTYGPGGGGSSFGNADLANLGSNVIVTTGNITGGNLLGIFASGNSNAAYDAAGGNLNISIGGNANVATFTSAGLQISGNAIGYLGIPQIPLTSNTTLAFTDQGKHYLSTVTAGNVQSLTIPTNANVAFPIGTAVSLIVQGLGTVQVLPEGNVLIYSGGNATAGFRTVNPYGFVTMLKTGTDTWFINGSGVY